MILQIDPDYEYNVRVGSQFRMKKYVTPLLEGNKRIIINKLSGNNDRRPNFITAVTDPHNWYITALGHGSYTVFTGQDGEILWNSDNNIDPAEVICRTIKPVGRIIHLLSCQTAKILGVELVKKGARAFFGYSENFRFYTSADIPETEILSDEKADPFFKADSEIDRCFFKRMTAEEAHNRVTKLYDSLIDEWTAVDTDIAALLNWDLKYFCSPSVDKKWGDKKAVLEIPYDDDYWLRFSNVIV